MDRRSAIKGGGLLLTAAAGGAFAPAVKASTRAKAILSDEFLITGFTPNTGGVGTIVTITGTGFDPNPDNHCCVLLDQPNGGLIPFRALEVGTDYLIADLLFLRPEAVPGRLAVAIGDGFRGPIVVEDADIPEPVWVWLKNGPEFVTDDIFTPILSLSQVAPRASSKAIDPNDPTRNCLTWNQACQVGDQFHILCRTWACQPGPHLDCYIPVFAPTTPMSASSCAHKIRDVIQAAYDAALGTDVAYVSVTLTQQGFEICTQLFNIPGDVSSGFHNLCWGDFTIWPV
jgi:hypothetical protein